MYNTNEIENFRRKCYVAYQLDWMISHGYSIADYVHALAEADQDAAVDDAYPEGDADYIYGVLSEAVEETGFGSGSIWVCYAEFLDAEYQDVNYMKHLLTTMGNFDELSKLYYEDTHYCLSSIPEFQVETSAGILNTYRSALPGQPGVVVMLQPDSYEEEIDCAYVSVYEDKNYRTSDNEGEKDVVIMSYGDATTEDYTTKEIIRRDDIIAGLGAAINA